jgi:PAS domain S-box-containing protein
MPQVLTTSDHQSIYSLNWESSLDGVFAVDAESGEVIDANPAAEELTGYSHDEFLGLHIAVLHPEAERAQVKALFLHRARNPSIHAYFQIERHDGQCIPVSISSSNSMVLDGRRVRVFVYRNNSALELSEHRFATRTWALQAFAGAALAFVDKHSSYESLLGAICEAITHTSVYSLAWIGIAEDGADKRVRIVASTGRAVCYLDGQKLSWSEDLPEGNGPIGLSIRNNQAQYIENCVEHPSFAPFRERALKAGIRSYMSVPFSVQGKMRGALVVYAEHPRAFEQVAIEVFQNLAEQIGRGIHALEQAQRLLDEQTRSAKLQLQLTEALSAMVLPIVAAMELRDPFTAGHQARVAEIAVAIAIELGWEEERVGGLRVAAQVHDIGKISIPIEILTKPGNLSKVERMLINAHPEMGHTILKGIPFAWPIAEIVRQHHEKLDGSGYPFGLKGDEILPEAKILAVADMVEAMCSDRPYRRAIDLDAVLLDLESQAGTQLDAEAVRICAALFRDKRLVLPLARQYIRELYS